jgi:hypothetical protein
MGQIGTIPTWMCPFTGDTFISKDYTIIALHSGENAWQMFGAKTPPVMEYLFGYYSAYLTCLLDKSEVSGCYSFTRVDSFEKA